MNMRDVTVAVPEESVAEFYLLVGRWLKGLRGEEAGESDAASAPPPGPRPPERPRARRASRYDAISGLLEEREENVVELSFDEIEAALEGPLPDSARRHRAWWSNTEASSQARAWLGAGYAVQQVDLEEGRVGLERR